MKGIINKVATEKSKRSTAVLRTYLNTRRKNIIDKSSVLKDLENLNKNLNRPDTLGGNIAKTLRTPDMSLQDTIDLGTNIDQSFIKNIITKETKENLGVNSDLSYDDIMHQKNPVIAGQQGVLSQLAGGLATSTKERNKLDSMSKDGWTVNKFRDAIEYVNPHYDDVPKGMEVDFWQAAKMSLLVILIMINLIQI